MDKLEFIKLADPPPILTISAEGVLTIEDEGQTLLEITTEGNVLVRGQLVAADIRIARVLQTINQGNRAIVSPKTH